MRTTHLGHLMYLKFCLVFLWPLLIAYGGDHVTGPNGHHVKFPKQIIIAIDKLELELIIDRLSTKYLFHAHFLALLCLSLLKDPRYVISSKWFVYHVYHFYTIPV